MWKLSNYENMGIVLVISTSFQLSAVQLLEIQLMCCLSRNEKFT